MAALLPRMRMSMTAPVDPAIFARPGDERCFGCGAENGEGLQLTFRLAGPGTVECEYTAPPHFCGSRAILHGGIQAVILDEVMGKAVRTAFPVDESRRTVTADLSLHYRSPVPLGEPLLARAQLDALDGRDVRVRAAILDSAGHELTTAEARWRVIDAYPGE